MLHNRIYIQFDDFSCSIPLSNNQTTKSIALVSLDPTSNWTAVAFSQRQLHQLLGSLASTTHSRTTSATFDGLSTGTHSPLGKAWFSPACNLWKTNKLLAWAILILRKQRQKQGLWWPSHWRRIFESQFTRSQFGLQGLQFRYPGHCKNGIDAGSGLKSSKESSWSPFFRPSCLFPRDLHYN